MVDISKFDGVEWEGAGYFGVPLPSPDEKFPQTPAAEPWTAFAVAVKYAKAGDFRYTRPLLDVILDKSCDPFVLAQTAQFLADASPDHVVDIVVDKVRNDAGATDGYLLIELCQIVAKRGRLADVPVLLHGYVSKHYLRDAEIIPVYLSDILEVKAGPVSAPEDLPSLEDYSHHVLNAQNDLAATLGMNTLVYQAAEYSVQRLSTVAAQHARSGSLSPDERQRFEAATGIDCTAFYAKERFQPLSAAEILESFLGSQAFSRFEPGKRYFFGHLIA